MSTSATTVSNPIQADAGYELETKRFGMWIFLAMEIMFFSGPLFVFWGEYHAYPEVFRIASEHLETGLAALNTVVLLTSSFTMALSVHFLERSRKNATLWSLALTTGLGVIFLALKSYEYFLDARHEILVGFGYHPDFNATRETYLFFSLYLFLTALHAVHLTIGVFWCGTIALGISRTQVPLKGLRGKVDVLGLYWHFVDIVWIFLLAVLYLLGAPS